jgi:hypothetical protein
MQIFNDQSSLVRIDQRWENCLVLSLFARHYLHLYATSSHVKVMDRQNTESTDRLLRVMIGLLVQRKPKETQTLRQQIGDLADLGLKPVEIADILGRTSIYINKELSGIRKDRKKQK